MRKDLEVFWSNSLLKGPDLGWVSQGCVPLRFEYLQYEELKCLWHYFDYPHCECFFHTSQSFLYCHIYLLAVVSSPAPPGAVWVALLCPLSLSSCRPPFRFHSFRFTCQFSQPLLILCSSPWILWMTLVLNLLLNDNFLYCAGHRWVLTSAKWKRIIISLVLLASPC